MADPKNTLYSNFYLSNETEDQFASKLDLNRFVTVDNNLVGTPGMIRKIHVYRATDGAQELGIGEGNTKSIAASFTEKNYAIKMVQARMEYYDEEDMIDPYAVQTGVNHMATDMYNTVNANIMDEYMKATMVHVVNKFDFAAFVDAQAAMNLENLEGTEIFAFVCPADVAAIRKELKDDLKYVEAFVRSGYVGTVGGVSLYTSKIVPTGNIVVATREAVTLFNKKGVSVERIGEGNRSEDAANVRLNTLFTRKYFLAALTNEAKDVLVKKGTASLSTDSTMSAEKKYYAKSDAAADLYIEQPYDAEANPTTKVWYEIA